MLSGYQLAERLNETFPEAMVTTELAVPRTLYITIKPSFLASICHYLFERGARFVTSLATDRITQSNRLEVSHIFSFDKDCLSVVVKGHASPSSLSLDSISPVIPGANWAERECHDVVGIDFTGHPDPRRLVLADDWPEGVYPLRRDYPHNYKPPAAPEKIAPSNIPPPPASVFPKSLFHPVLEEPEYFRVFVEKQEVTGCDFRGFHNQWGIEKMGESSLTYQQVPFIAERTGGVGGFAHSTGYCQAVEQAAEIEIPPRAAYIRTILLELERIHSHLFWFGTMGHVMGFETALMQAWRVLEPVMWLCELITGNRKTYGMNLIGGVRRDITLEQYHQTLAVTGKMETQLKEFVEATVNDTTLHLCLGNVGVLPRQAARQLCSVGPTIRGSGIAIDSRVNHPYAAYSQVPPRVMSKPEGDVWARTLVRLEEASESVNIVRRALKQMPAGDIMADVKEIPSQREGISYVEAPRGEAIHYVLTGPDNRPYRWHVRTPTFANLQSVPAMLKGNLIADVPVILGSIDPCFSYRNRLEVVDVRTNKIRVYTEEKLRAINRDRMARRLGSKSKETLIGPENLKLTLPYPTPPAPPAVGFRERLEVNVDRCIGCSACANACPPGIISITDTDTRRTIAFALEECLYCARCADLCPEEAINVSQVPELATDDKSDSNITVELVLVKCEQCGTAFTTQRIVDKLMAEVPKKVDIEPALDWLKLCPDCRKSREGQKISASWI